MSIDTSNLIYRERCCGDKQIREESKQKAATGCDAFSVIVHELKCQVVIVKGGGGGWER